MQVAKKSARSLTCVNCCAEHSVANNGSASPQGRTRKQVGGIKAPSKMALAWIIVGSTVVLAATAATLTLIYKLNHRSVEPFTPSSVTRLPLAANP